MKDSPAGCCDGSHDGLVPVDQVRREVLDLITPVRGDNAVPLGSAVGHWLAADIIAPLALPPRDNSAVDGYALGSAGADSHTVCARTAAGQAAHPETLGPADALRIFTGAPVPPGTAAIAMQEDVLRDGDRIRLTARAEPGQHIRRGGEDVAAGEVLIAGGTRLDPRHVAILAASGLTCVPVTRPLRVALFSTGRELVEPGSPLGAASIHDSNRWMLKSLLRDDTVAVQDIGILPDDPDAIAAAVADAAPHADLLLSTGGVSLGEEDHVLTVLARLGAAPQQRRMAVKPGKPVVFGKLGGAVALGLPGNPVAALVSFLLLARPCLAALAGGCAQADAPQRATAAFHWARRAGRTEFFPARQIARSATGQPVLDKLGKGGSAQLKPLLIADGLARLAADVTGLEPGDRLDWFPFHAGFAL